MNLARYTLLVCLSMPLGVPAFERTEERQPCAEYDRLKRPHFGDLHVHSRFSFDAYVSSVRLGPGDAYRFAKGESIDIPAADGEGLIKKKISRPLDFVSVTDHSEFLGPIDICTSDAGRAGYWWPHCMMTRSTGQWTQMLAVDWWTGLGGLKSGEKEQSFACTLSDCEAAAKNAWQQIQQAAEDHYDRSESCGFTTFVGYEYTDAPERKNMHRNVIFRNAHVPEFPISTYETGRYNFPVLWQRLRQVCTSTETGCDVLAIPHNPNLAGGLMYRDPETPQELEDRLFFEPLVELVQHKGASECRFDRLSGGLDTVDELCDFEQVPADNLAMLGTVNGRTFTEQTDLVPIDKFHRRNMVRNVYKDGLAYGQNNGTNPFVMGVIGSTDTHSASPGATEEDDFKGHLGRRDSEFRNVQDHFYSNPGGHAVVWAEENSRDAIFEGMRNKETYATSGTRPVVRFFAGPELPDTLCEQSDPIAAAYQSGVPMGGQLESSDEPTKVFVSVLKDAGVPGNPGTDLQRVQVVKGWVDADGNTHEKVFEVAGDADNGAWVNEQTCERVGRGAPQLCQVWQDPEFESTQPAFYYARVLENPTCRWTTLQCQAAGVNPFDDNCPQQAQAATEHAIDNLGASGDVYGKCCIDPADDSFYSPVIQERAWTSPIWYKQAEGENQ